MKNFSLFHENTVTVDWYAQTVDSVGMGLAWTRDRARDLETAAWRVVWDELWRDTDASGQRTCL